MDKQVDIWKGFSSHTVSQLRTIAALLNRLDPQAQLDALIVPGSPEPRGNIIVFPGSFNPPTNAHLAMLQQAQHYGREHGGMHVYAAISKHTTDKENVQRPLLVDRVLLLEEIMQRYLQAAGVMLFNRGLYVEQAEGIRRRYPAVATLYFLVGFDKIVQVFDTRYYSDREKALHELFALADILVAPRANAGEHELKQLLQKPENRQFASHVHALPLNEAYRNVSSTHIRQDFARYASDVPPEVRQFIQETHAYEPAQRLPDGREIDRYGERMLAIQNLLRQTGGAV